MSTILALRLEPPPPVHFPERPPEIRLTLLTAGGRRWPGFALSVVLHVIGILSLPAIMQRAFVRHALEGDGQRTDRIMRTTRIKIPEQLYLAAPGPDARSKTKVFRAKAAAAPKQSGPAGMSGARPRRSGREFELPALPVRTVTDQSLIQPNKARDVQPSAALKLPELFFWSPELTPSEVRPFVQPGHAQPPRIPMGLDSAPKLETPGPDPAGLSMSLAPSMAALLFAPPPATPIRTTFTDRPPAGGAVADPTKGDPTTVLSVSGGTMPLREFVTVPPGNQVGRTPGSLTAGYGSADATGSGLGTSGAGFGTGTMGAGTGAGGAAIPPPLPSSSPLPLSEAVQATRMLHPSTGVFDVVVQSAGLEGFPESAGVLSGKPVYSVYLQVGSRRDWILQYCIPAGEEVGPQTEGAVVRIGPSNRLNAPYPLVTMRPVGYDARSAGYLMLHGYVTAEGKFSDLRVLGAHDPYQTAGVLQVLDHWDFRPASQAGQALRVEVLLAIPAE